MNLREAAERLRFDNKKIYKFITQYNLLTTSNSNESREMHPYKRQVWLCSSFAKTVFCLNLFYIFFVLDADLYQQIVMGRAKKENKRDLNRHIIISFFWPSDSLVIAHSK